MEPEMHEEEVHVFVAHQRFESFESMRAFVDATYDEDGDQIASPFMREVGLERYEPACIEATWTPTRSSLSSLMGGASYADQWLRLVDPSITASEAICVYSPNVLRHPSATSLRYCGSYPYRR
jgi:hypothetical protein